jgi:hypothetical protein
MMDAPDTSGGSDVRRTPLINFKSGVLAAPVEANQRRLTIGITIATLVTLCLVTALLAVGGRPDPQPLRATSILLDGGWQFHTGDNPRWAALNMDDKRWETIDMTAPPGSHDGDVGLPDYVGGWMAHGHPNQKSPTHYGRVRHPA